VPAYGGADFSYQSSDPHTNLPLGTALPVAHVAVGSAPNVCVTGWDLRAKHCLSCSGLHRRRCYGWRPSCHLHGSCRRTGGAAAGRISGVTHAPLRICSFSAMWYVSSVAVLQRLGMVVSLIHGCVRGGFLTFTRHERFQQMSLRTSAHIPILAPWWMKTSGLCIGVLCVCVNVVRECWCSMVSFLFSLLQLWILNIVMVNWKYCNWRGNFNHVAITIVLQCLTTNSECNCNCVCSNSNFGCRLDPLNTLQMRYCHRCNRLLRLLVTTPINGPDKKSDLMWFSFFYDFFTHGVCSTPILTQHILRIVALYMYIYTYIYIFIYIYGRW
jgi:hypothetical protein